MMTRCLLLLAFLTGCQSTSPRPPEPLTDTEPETTTTSDSTLPPGADVQDGDQATGLLAEDVQAFRPKPGEPEIKHDRADPRRARPTGRTRHPR